LIAGSPCFVTFYANIFVITSDNINRDGKRIKAMAQGTRLHVRGEKTAHGCALWKPVFSAAPSSSEGNQDGHAEWDTQRSRIENEMRCGNDSLSSPI
jgi:hypothetical protein